MLVVFCTDCSVQCAKGKTLSEQDLQPEHRKFSFLTTVARVQFPIHLCRCEEKRTLSTPS